jgi:hypothetical protein
VARTLQIEKDLAREELGLEPEQLLGVFLHRTEQTESLRLHLACGVQCTRLGKKQ